MKSGNNGQGFPGTVARRPAKAEAQRERERPRGRECQSEQARAREREPAALRPWPAPATEAHPAALTAACVFAVFSVCPLGGSAGDPEGIRRGSEGIRGQNGGSGCSASYVSWGIRRHRYPLL